MSLFRRLILNTSGQDMIEYALLVGLLAVGAVAMFARTTDSATNLFARVERVLDAVAPQGSAGGPADTAGSGGTGSSSAGSGNTDNSNNGNSGNNGNHGNGSNGNNGNHGQGNNGNGNGNSN